MRRVFALWVVSLPLVLSVCGCIVPLPIIGGGIAGAGADPIWVREQAEQYPLFQADNVRMSAVRAPAVFRVSKDRDHYFSDFANHVHVAEGVPTRLGRYQLSSIHTAKSEAGIHITIARGGEVIVAERIPRAFYMGDLQAALIEINGTEYWLLAANSRTSTNRSWFGLYRADGLKLFAASLPQSVMHVGRQPSGIAILSTNDRGIHIDFN